MSVKQVIKNKKKGMSQVTNEDLKNEGEKK